MIEIDPELLAKIERIQVATVAPSDVLIVRLSERVPQSVLDRIADMLKGVWPDNKVVVLHPGAVIDITRPLPQRQPDTVKGSWW